ncbi:Pyridoxal phosphate-dependent transferase [Amanita muscaria]
MSQTTLGPPLAFQFGIPALPTLSLQDRFAVIGSWFLGPRAENAKILSETTKLILEEIETGRKEYFPEDPVSIRSDMQDNSYFQQSIANTKITLLLLSRLLARHSAPFYSPRYAAHMTGEISLPSTLGYMVAMFYNQNNVAPEGGPLTTVLEYDVCQQLCRMVGFKTIFHLPGDPIPWGHITAGGSIANLESMWVARNLKYYPLSLKAAMAPGEPLSFAVSLKITLCDGQQKEFGQCTVWELLNLTPTEVLDLPDHLFSQFGIPPQTLATILEEYSVQTVGKGKLDLLFGITKPPVFLISPTNHYSWPKGAAITGIGSENLVELDIDLDARLDVQSLRRRFDDCLKHQQAVYAVVVIAGSTEHGAIDPISKVLKLRELYQAKGLSFMIHADAAWGGYFATKVERLDFEFDPVKMSERFAFSLPLSKRTNKELWHLRSVDSVTIDPHKSGYVPYPGGSLCYRDGRLRFLITWNSPVLNIGPKDSGALGIFGVEGSTPGASAAAIWLSHQSLRLKKDGYGYLLGTAMLTGIKMYMRWATLTIDSNTIIVTPMKMLHAEREDPPDPEKVKREREDILALLKLSDSDLEARKKELLKWGSDLMINAFACNFYIDGKPNTDVVEANYLNTRLYDRLSVRKLEDKLHKRPLILYSTRFQQKSYGPCLTRFRTRLRLDPTDDEDLVALANTSMSPFPTANGLVDMVIDAFKKIAEEEVKKILKIRYPRWKVYPCIHAFLMQGFDPLYLVHLPLFNIANHKRQIIATGTLLPEEAMEVYKKAYEENPTEPLVIFDTNPSILLEMLQEGSFIGDIYHGSPTRKGSDPTYQPIFSGAMLKFEEILINRSIDRRDLQREYPRKMPFYLYGSPESAHIDHILLRAPNSVLCATAVDIWVDAPLTDLMPAEGLKLPLVAILEDVYESTMQPFGKSNAPTFFGHGKIFKVTIYSNNGDSATTVWDESAPLATGKLKIGPGVWREYIFLNIDILPPHPHTTIDDIPFQLRSEKELMDVLLPHPLSFQNVSDEKGDKGDTGDRLLSGEFREVGSISNDEDDEDDEDRATIEKFYSLLGSGKLAQTQEEE